MSFESVEAGKRGETAAPMERWSAREKVATHAVAGAALLFLLSVPVAWLVDQPHASGLRKLSRDIGDRSVAAREPLHPEDTPEEIAPLIEVIDALVECHQQALEAQRRFVADAAYELRIPLAALQIQTENLSAGNFSGHTKELVAELGAGVRRPSLLPNQLLEMPRSEGTATRVRQDVDLATPTNFCLLTLSWLPKQEVSNLSWMPMRMW